MEWRDINSHPPKKFRTMASSIKVMASMFWDAIVVMHMQSLEKGQQVNVGDKCSLLK
jgi:hypothetical protein